MKINLKSILNNEVNFIEVDEKNTLELYITDRDSILDVSVQAKGNIINSRGKLLLDLIVCYHYDEFCDRCLKPVKAYVETNISGFLVSQKEILNAEPDEAEYCLGYDNYNFDLTEHLQGAVYVSLPMKVLCDNNCKGLCLKCGQDLNLSECDCDTFEIDPRLEGLKDFFDKNREV